MGDNFAGWVANGVVTVIVAVIGFFVKHLHGRIDRIEQKADVSMKSLAAHKLHAAETFITERSMEKMEKRLLDRLQKIEDKLDKNNGDER